jgi:hypothetical protein
LYPLFRFPIVIWKHANVLGSHSVTSCPDVVSLFRCHMRILRRPKYRVTKSMTTPVALTLSSSKLTHSHVVNNPYILTRRAKRCVWNIIESYYCGQFCVRCMLKLYMRRRMVSYGMLRRLALVRTDVSEEPVASFIKVTRIGELGTTLATPSNGRSQRTSVASCRFCCS